MIKNNFIILYTITSIILLSIGTNYNLAMEDSFNNYLDYFNTFENDMTPHEQIFFEILALNKQQLPETNEQIFNDNNTLLSNTSKKHPREEKTPQNQKNYKKQKTNTSEEKKESYQEQKQNNVSTTILFPCLECNKTFKHKKNLSQHLQSHSEKSYTCEHCNKILKCKRCLSQHMQLHSDKIPYQCDDCSKTFKLKDSLSKHINAKHGKNKEYICHYAGCNNAFKTKSGLTAHIAAKHENIRYNCFQCNKIFIKKNNLKIHINKIHKK